MTTWISRKYYLHNKYSVHSIGIVGVDSYPASSEPLFKKMSICMEGIVNFCRKRVIIAIVPKLYPIFMTRNNSSSI